MFHFVNYKSLYDNPGTGEVMINNTSIRSLAIIQQFSASNVLLGVTIFVRCLMLDCP